MNNYAQNRQSSMTSPEFYAGQWSELFGSNGKGKGRKSKKDDGQYDEKMKQLLKELGLAPPEEEEEPNRGLPFMYLGGGGGPSIRGAAPSQMIYSMPSSMQAPGGYSPLAMAQSRNPIQMPYGMQGMPGDGNTSMININYTAPDGTRYSMGVMAPQENRSRALYNILGGLYGLMMAEGKTGEYKGGKGGGYAGRGGYAAKGK